MEKEFKKLYNLLKLDRKKSPWSKSNTINSRFNELKKEIDEVENALKNKDYKNLEEELGDSLLDLIFISIIAEEKKLFTLKNVLHKVINKINRRKPWIHNNEKLTIKEELKRWEESKKKEKK